MFKIKENMEYLTSLFLSIFAALFIGAIIMVFNGQNPIVGYGALVVGAFGSKYKIATTFAKTVPLILTGLATAISFMSGIFNIGGEGQLYLGAFAAAYVGFTFTGLPVFVVIILAIMASALVGGLYAYFPGVLKVKYNIDEVITTIMLNSVAILFTNYLVNYPFAASQGKMGGTDMISEAFKFTKLVRLSKLNTSIFYTALIAIFMYYLIKKTSFGYNFKMVGENGIFAKYAGVNNKKYMIRAMIISGALCGIAGAFEVYGVHYRFLQNISKGYAFDGMLIALIVRNNPVGIVLMSIFFAMLKTGSNSMEIATGIPSELILVIQSIIILFIAGENGFKKIIKKRKLNKGKLVK
ncbi:MAG: ABC transporter permease [Anaeromicrobium sp.]|jgi:simple sugar transport system permease protein|uniref:ABC transporter permease n=1 Tax=Anaeromicrobium sp. TaxID=1929132 RepID=UPI0025DEC267|nr:ABC transporter permease [Anaeromicrobium sp.]MCT4594834.1 ABC transporter permease [Anaeromicrobium sp.]